MNSELFKELWQRDIALALRQGAGIFAKCVGYFPPGDSGKGVIISLPEKDIFTIVPVEKIKVDEVKETATYQDVELPIRTTKLFKNPQDLIDVN